MIKGNCEISFYFINVLLSRYSNSYIVFATKIVKFSSKGEFNFTYCTAYVLRNPKYRTQCPPFKPYLGKGYHESFGKHSL